MRLDGFGLFVEDMAKMIRFYRDVLGFEIKEAIYPKKIAAAIPPLAALIPPVKAPINP